MSDEAREPSVLQHAFTFFAIVAISGVILWLSGDLTI